MADKTPKLFTLKAQKDVGKRWWVTTQNIVQVSDLQNMLTNKSVELFWVDPMDTKKHNQTLLYQEGLSCLDVQDVNSPLTKYWKVQH